MTRAIIVGAGGGGLAAALELANSGFDVTVLESHIYAGGCAGTFYHKKYRFDAGATLAGGFKENGPMDIIANRFDIDWKGRVDDIGIKVHLKGHPCITRRIDEKAWEKERFEQFGRSGEKFWKWQENTADLLWDLALRYPPWPPKKFKDFRDLWKIIRNTVSYSGKSGNLRKFLHLGQDAFRPLKYKLEGVSERCVDSSTPSF